MGADARLARLRERLAATGMDAATIDAWLGRLAEADADIREAALVWARRGRFPRRPRSAATRPRRWLATGGPRRSSRYCSSSAHARTLRAA